MSWVVTFRWPLVPAPHRIVVETEPDAEQLAAWHREAGAVEISVVEVSGETGERS